VRTRALVLDEHSMIRKTLKILLQKLQVFDLVGEVGCAAEARELFHAHKPRFIIMDIMLSGTNGLRLIEEFTNTSPETNILVYSSAIGRALGACCLKAGARGFIEKSKPMEDLMQAIENVGILNKSYFGNGEQPMIDSAEGILTQRENQIAAMIARSFSNKEIARELQVSVNTVEVHRSNLMRKLGVHDTAAITRYAIQRGLIALQ
jgi:DNA-binding NarL/FixJ family response regulator